MMADARQVVREAWAKGLRPDPLPLEELRRRAARIAVEARNLRDEMDRLLRAQEDDDGE
jgi:hypothetical protein